MQSPRAPRPAPQTGRTRARIRNGLLGVIAVLYVVSVPWYRSADEPLRIVLGLPDWVAVAVLCYVAVAVLNSIAWWLTDIDDAAAPPDSMPHARRDAEGRAEA
jgi:hypothetical protein